MLIDFLLCVLWYILKIIVETNISYTILDNNRSLVDSCLLFKGVGTMVIKELADDTMSKCVTNAKSLVCVIAENQIVMMRSISKLANKKSIDVYKQPQNPTTPRIKESVKQRNVGTGFIELFFHFKCKM